MAAVAAGADVVKLFPAGLGGPGYLAALRGPFPDVRFVPTGGIRVSDVPTWLEGGAVCVGLGSSLVGGSPPRTRADLDRITADARRAVELARGDP
jgi:2-dehydro-3-deoxyphosphogluconate aldolase/(4S)-4-hydroxy-2-oxoglutarate aldolase